MEFSIRTRLELYGSTSSANNLQTASISDTGSITLNAMLQPALSQTAYAGTSGTWTGVAAPANPVSFYDGATLAGTATLSANGTLASLTINNPAAGPHTYTAQYPGERDGHRGRGDSRGEDRLHRRNDQPGHRYAQRGYGGFHRHVGDRRNPHHQRMLRRRRELRGIVWDGLRHRDSDPHQRSAGAQPSDYPRWRHGYVHRHVDSHRRRCKRHVPEWYVDVGYWCH